MTLLIDALAGNNVRFPALTKDIILMATVSTAFTKVQDIVTYTYLGPRIAIALGRKSTLSNHRYRITVHAN